MTKDKYTEIASEVFNEIGFMDFADPDKWVDARDKLSIVIKELDKAHEVYQMENTSKVSK